MHKVLTVLSIESINVHDEGASTKRTDWSGYTTPALINKVYDIPDNNGHNFGSFGGDNLLFPYLHLAIIYLFSK